MSEREDAARLGKYDLFAELPEEDLGNVYLAAAVGPAGLSTLAVVHTLRPELAADAAFVAKFLGQSNLGARLNHANIVQTQDVGVDRGRPYVSLEYLEGQTLASVIERVHGADAASSAGFPRAMWLRVLVDVLAGLHHAHETLGESGEPLGVVHGRLGPASVFVTYDGQVKLLGFGRIDAPVRAPASLGRLSPYVAPEVARGAPSDRRADVYSVGVMIRDAIGGDRDAPPALLDIVTHSAAEDPEARYATAMHMQSDLEGFLRVSAERSSPRDLGRLVAQAFLDERLRATTVIDEQMRRLRARALSGEETVSILRLQVGKYAPTPTPLVEIAPAPGSRRASAQPSRPGWVGVAAVVAVLFLLGALALLALVARK